MTLRKRLYWVLGTVAIMLMAGTGGALAAGGGGSDASAGRIDDDDQPITGSALAECTAAALAANPGGTVTETEVGDDGAAYGVEIRLAAGSEVEVNLDENCRVIGQAADDGDDQDGGYNDDNKGSGS